MLTPSFAKSKGDYHVSQAKKLKGRVSLWADAVAAWGIMDASDQELGV